MNRIHPLAIGIDSEKGLAHLMLGSNPEPAVTIPLPDSPVTWSEVLGALTEAHFGESKEVPR